jgi:hypothetical protein
MVKEVVVVVGKLERKVEKEVVVVKRKTWKKMEVWVVVFVVLVEFVVMKMVVVLVE